MELLSPVGNFEHLVTAVQNGADAVYLGTGSFNARANAQNFNKTELKEAILYARKRGVEVHLTLNILFFNREMEEALKIAKFAYECGVSAVIVQDIGLVVELKKHFPDLPLHSSTQMTISNIDGVKMMEKLGFQRVVLARELSLSEIKAIREQTSIELECFGHGALCVSYSGQCLFSSMVGKRSGNRGLCAGPCRLNYQLLKNGNVQENGYLLSPKDVCTLQILPQLIDCGIDSLKIEGRKKSYEYVSIVTKIYRKYIDLAQDKTKEYKVEEEDLKQLLQIYNRGGMGTGYFENRQNIVYPEKPNHLGIYIGDVKHVFPKKKQIEIELKDEIGIGDVIRIQENSAYVSEIVNGNRVGEIKAIRNVKQNDKVYKIVNHDLNKKQWEIFNKETKKIDISCKMYQNGENLCMDIYNEKIRTKTAIKLTESGVNELDKSRIISQIQKTGNTIFTIKNVEINIENLRLPIRQINQLRREAIQEFEKALEANIQRNYEQNIEVKIEYPKERKHKQPKVNLYLQKFNPSIDYEKLDYHEIYIELKDLVGKPQIRDCIVVLPNIMDEEYEKLVVRNREILEQAKAIMISHISQIEFLRRLGIQKKIMGNDTLNITNNWSEKVIKDLKIERFTMSPELNKSVINEFGNTMEKELVVYGRTCLMTSKYCPIGKQKKNCGRLCQKGIYELKDRKNFVFPIVSDCIDCHTKIYNSKILSIDYQNFDVDFVRIDILEESEQEIEKIITTVKSGQKLKGINYTNGNL